MFQTTKQSIFGESTGATFTAATSAWSNQAIISSPRELQTSRERETHGEMAQHIKKMVDLP